MLLALFLVGAAALGAWKTQESLGDAGAFAVLVVGPDGALFDGRVEAANATALSLLLATGLDVERDDYPGMGTYVRSVGGFAASGASGWVYEVERDGAWLSGDRSAARFAVREGEALRWSWTT